MDEHDRVAGSGFMIVRPVTAGVDDVAGFERDLVDCRFRLQT
jgi:hypothetical protein